MYKITHEGKLGGFTGNIPTDKNVFNKNMILIKNDVLLGEEFIYINNGTKVKPKFELFEKSGDFMTMVQVIDGKVVINYANGLVDKI